MRKPQRAPIGQLECADPPYPLVLILQGPNTFKEVFPVLHSHPSLIRDLPLPSSAAIKWLPMHLFMRFCVYYSQDSQLLRSGHFLGLKDDPLPPPSTLKQQSTQGQTTQPGPVGPRNLLSLVPEN